MERKKILSVALILVILCLTGCGASTSKSNINTNRQREISKTGIAITSLAVTQANQTTSFKNALKNILDKDFAAAIDDLHEAKSQCNKLHQNLDTHFPDDKFLHEICTSNSKNYQAIIKVIKDSDDFNVEDLDDLTNEVMQLTASNT